MISLPEIKVIVIQINWQPAKRKYQQTKENWVASAYRVSETCSSVVEYR